MKRKLFSDPTFWLLLAINIGLVYSYEQNPAIFTTLIWLYWAQSILYGFFNFLDILSVRKADVSAMRSYATKTKSDRAIANGAAWFFLFHFGFFHVAYCVFLFAMKKTGAFDWAFYEKYLIAFTVFQVFSFIQHKIQNKDRAVDISKMVTTPYLRIIPMHLCILIPAFINVSNMTIFLVLKVITDMASYRFARNYNNKNDVVANASAINIDSTI